MIIIINNNNHHHHHHHHNNNNNNNNNNNKNSLRRSPKPLFKSNRQSKIKGSQICPRRRLVQRTSYNIGGSTTVWIGVAIDFCLSASKCQLHLCICGKPVDARGLHGFTCRKSAPIHIRHSLLNDFLWMAVKTAQMPACNEPLDLLIQRKETRRCCINTMGARQADGTRCHMTEHLSSFPHTSHVFECRSGDRQRNDGKDQLVQWFEQYLHIHPGGNLNRWFVKLTDHRFAAKKITNQQRTTWKSISLPEHVYCHTEGMHLRSRA